MNKRLIAPMLLLSALIVLGTVSCKKKKKKDEPIPGLIFEIEASGNLVLDYSWAVDGFTGAGNTVVDMDFILGDTAISGSRSSSTSSYSYEQITFLNSNANKDYFLGYKYYRNVASISGNPVIRYTLTAYPAGSSTVQTYSGLCSGQAASYSRVPFFLKMVKNGNKYQFFEVNFEKRY